MECASLTLPAFGPCIAAHHAGQLLADGEPQTGAAVFAGGGTVRLLERFEYGIDLVAGDADAGIGNARVQFDFLVGLGFHFQ